MFLALVLGGAVLIAVLVYEHESRTRDTIYMFSCKSKKLLLAASGFTVAEMMAAMGVFAILVAVAVPNYLSLQPGMRLNGAAREVLAKMLWARAKAVEQNNQYVVTFPTNHSLMILDDKNTNGVADPGEWTQTIDLQTDYHDVTFTTSASDARFSSRGTASAALTITVANSSGTRTVTVSSTGNVKVN